eukprot:7066470-Prymnesium_polylepis.1
MRRFGRGCTSGELGGPSPSSSVGSCAGEGGASAGPTSADGSSCIGEGAGGVGSSIASWIGSGAS